ncbi:hypothetical protein [Fervidibacter sacchari]
MELQGRMDENGRMWLTISVRGMRGETTVEAMVDSGYIWALALPVSFAVPLGLELVDFCPVELADGTVKREFPTVCLVTETGTPLIGTLFMQSVSATLIAKFAESTVALNLPNA